MTDKKKYKTEFELEVLSSSLQAKVFIIGSAPENIPYVKIETEPSNGMRFSACIKDKDLERFAVNILRALNSKIINP